MQRQIIGNVNAERVDAVENNEGVNDLLVIPLLEDRDDIARHHPAHRQHTTNGVCHCNVHLGSVAGNNNPSARFRTLSVGINLWIPSLAPFHSLLWLHNRGILVD